MSNIATPEPVLYISEPTAQSMGLRPEDMVTSPFQGKYVFLHNKAEVTDLRAIQEEFKRTKRGQRGNEIDRPIIAMGADNVTPTMMIADNVTEAEEVQDILGQQLEKQEAELKKSRSAGNKSPVIDTEWIRYVNNLPPSSEFDRFFKQTLQDRIKKHKENPITDPGRDPWREAKDAGYLPDNAQVSVPENYNISESDGTTESE